MRYAFALVVLSCSLAALAASSSLEQAQDFLRTLNDGAACDILGAHCEEGDAVRCGENLLDKRSGRVRLPAAVPHPMARGTEVRVTTGSDGRAVVVEIAAPQPEALALGAVRISGVFDGALNAGLAHVGASSGPDGLVAVAGYFLPLANDSQTLIFVNILSSDNEIPEFPYETPAFALGKVGGWWGVIDNSGRWIHVGSSADEPPLQDGTVPRVSMALGAAIDREGYLYVLRGFEERNETIFDCETFSVRRLELRMYAPKTYELLHVLEATGTPFFDASACEDASQRIIANFVSRSMHVEYDRLVVSGGFNGDWTFGGQLVTDPGNDADSIEQDRNSISPIVLLVKIGADHSSLEWGTVLHAVQQAPLSYTLTPIEGLISVPNTNFYAGAQAWAVRPSRTATEDSIYVIGSVQHSPVSIGAQEPVPCNASFGSVLFQPGAVSVTTAPGCTSTAPFVGRFDVTTNEWAFILVPDTADSSLYLSFFYDVEIDDRGRIHVVGQLPPYASMPGGFQIGGVRTVSGERWAHAHPNQFIGLHLTISRSGRVVDLDYEASLSSMRSISRTASPDVLFWAGSTQTSTFARQPTVQGLVYPEPPAGGFSFLAGGVLPNTFIYAPTLVNGVLSTSGLQLSDLYQSFGDDTPRDPTARYLVISAGGLFCPACILQAKDYVQTWAPLYGGPAPSLDCDATTTNCRGFVFATAAVADAARRVPTSPEEQAATVLAYANATGVGTTPYTIAGGDWQLWLGRLQGFENLLPAAFAIDLRTMQYYGLYTGRQPNDGALQSAFGDFLAALQREDLGFFQTFAQPLTGYMTLDGQRLTATPTRSFNQQLIGVSATSQPDAFSDDQGYETYLQNTGIAQIVVAQTRAIADSLKMPSIGYVVSDLDPSDNTVCVAFPSATVIERGAAEFSRASNYYGVYTWHGSSLNASQPRVIGQRDISARFAGITLNEREFLAH